ncbi:MAG: hypothetical protein QGG38_02600 [Nitrospinaceae bacterium]|jgi:hypothetical protein|nr:hypothetical protein [Nitrospinaceae bacterium]MDP6476528.1 hypothetical protein [Nitrospinaceae bacterium]MDP6657011.1 hypothetical protein [Nitrospinaceae bacterium]MDP6711559.1 hypothetical protein [Nitrospinaceae bacterium]MDP7108631.1 hypothetical protein [Nitrospinaceae bacterium]|tara:strand:- start:938 stop:1123 length:186 start_codon:yes stop_codon:yes gene_type:complete
MTERKKRPKMIFRKFLKDNQKILKEFDTGETEKYVRDSWMMQNNPPADVNEEILREEAENF